jgi:hypothetical protein
MQGEEGVGKGTLANAFGKVFGQHALHITHTKHLTGNFNAHLQDCVFLFADEAFFAGDREHSGVLRGLITERDHTIEDKYRRIVKSPNHVHMMMASNDDWIVPASLTDRRFCVLRTSSARKGDTEYFKAINDQLEAGGYEAMLDELLHRDLSGFDVRRIPNTAARDSQKLRSMKLHEKWWMEVLSRGYVFESKLGCEDFFSHWESTVAMELLYKSYLATPIGRAPRESREDIGKFLTKVGGKKVRPRSAYVGEHLESGPDGKGVAREPVLQTDPRPYCYDFGPLDLARAKFEAAIGVAINWGEDGEEIEPAPEDKQTLDDAIEFDDAQRRLRRDRRRSREDD